LGHNYWQGHAARRSLPFSQFALSFQRHCLEAHPAVREAITRKMTVMLPPQKTLVDEYADKNLDDSFIHLAFVGNDFFRKGGREVLRAMVRLIRDKFPLKLTIVSRMDYGDYASRTTIEDVADARHLISSLEGHITFYTYLSNADVLQLFIDSHIALLPTYDDTFGFSVLEAQAAACPVISTDVCALTEVNDDSTGWIISVLKNELGMAQMASASERKILSDAIEEGIVQSLRSICNRPDLIRVKGLRAWNQIKRNHDPQRAAWGLQEIYRETLGDH
jgi:glycosyltransferase involved in cell wall biosynthesis